MSIINDIKNQVKKSGSNKGKLLYLKSGVKIRVRFLSDMEDGTKVLFHDSFAEGINVPCQELFDRECKYHDAEDLRHRDNFIWSVWDYESKEVKLLMSAVNNCSPIPSLMGMYDNYGTLTDRDYIITKSGQGTTTSYSVVPMDKVKFKNKKAKPFSESKILEIIDKAFPADDADDDEEDEDKPKKNKKGKNKKAAKKSKKHDIDDDDEEDLEDDEDEDEEEETPKKTKKGKKKVVEEEEDEEEEEEDEGDDSDEEEESDEDEIDYEDMSAKELYKLCKERGINVKPKKNGTFYIAKLEENDEEDEEVDW